MLERRPGIGLFRSGGDRNFRRVRFLVGKLLWQSSIRMSTGFRRGAAAAGVDVEMRDAEGEVEKLKAELAALPTSGVAGAAVISIHLPALAAEITRIAASGFPLVVLDEAFERSGVPSFISDNILGGRLAAERLILAGHRVTDGGSFCGPNGNRW